MEKSKELIPIYREVFHNEEELRWVCDVCGRRYSQEFGLVLTWERRLLCRLCYGIGHPEKSAWWGKVRPGGKVRLTDAVRDRSAPGYLHGIGVVVAMIENVPVVGKKSGTAQVLWAGAALPEWHSLEELEMVEVSHD